MLYDERGKDRDEKRVSTFEEKWSRRLALIVGVVGLAVFGLVLGIGLVDRFPGPASESPVPCGTLVDRCFEPLLLNAHTPPLFRPLAIPEARKKQLTDRFKRGPLYWKIYRDTVRWFKEERNLDVVDDHWDERRKVTDYLQSRFLEIDDAVFIADLEKSPHGRFLLETLRRDEISKDRTIMMASYARLITHYDCFIELDTTRIKDLARPDADGFTE